MIVDLVHIHPCGLILLQVLIDNHMMVQLIKLGISALSLLNGRFFDSPKADLNHLLIVRVFKKSSMLNFIMS